MNEQSTPLEKVNSWIKNSVMLKLITITILVLLLLIPASMIRSIIYEREQLSEEAIAEVSAKWAESQLINGPILSIPLIFEYRKDDKITEVEKHLHLLPEDLTMEGKIDPEKLRRGIYEIVVYRSHLDVRGSFSLPSQVNENNLKEILWDQAFLTVGISDLKGIEDEISFKWNNQQHKAEPGSRIPEMIYSGITIDLPDLQNTLDKPISFQFGLDLQGSRNLSFIPAGKTTSVHLSSSWPAPSFDGNFLPDSRTIRESGFDASWKILQLNRNFPQKWIGSIEQAKMAESTFGVNLILPLDDYQKSMRSAKYAVMTIALTFLIFFLVEVLNGRKIHPFQYTLVGLALCLFYILLVSISEHSDFNTAYFISSMSIVTMISLYSIHIFKNKRLTLLLMATLIGIYGFLFVTLQLADYALLMGSIGLSLILGATMYFTRNINWYKLTIQTD